MNSLTSGALIRAAYASPWKNWSLIGLHGSEGISELFEFTVAAQPNDEAPIALDELIGVPVGIAMEHGIEPRQERKIHGVVWGARELTLANGAIGVELTVVPAVRVLSVNQQFRVFQQRTVPQILAELFDGFDVALKLAREYPPRNICVQYRESDFAFASRLMEDEGIFYFFEHHGDKHRMVLCDDSSRCPEIAADNGEVVYDRQIGGVVPGRIREWSRRQQIVASNWTLIDHHCQLRDPLLNVSETLPEFAGAGRQQRLRYDERFVVEGRSRLRRMFESVEYPAAVAQRFDDAQSAISADRTLEAQRRLAKVRAESSAATAVGTTGSGDCLALRAGHRFQLRRHPNADGPYLATRLIHALRPGVDAGTMEYDVQFEALPGAVPYRPARTMAAPHIDGIQTATVVGPQGEEIYADESGRIKVQFHWDRDGKNDAGSFCWVRVASPWAGKDMGMLSLPRVGHEVAVTFENGDPDVPLVVGSVYNANCPPPFKLPLERDVMGLKTRSRGGDSTQFSGLGFCDQAGREQVQLHSERDLTVNAEHNALQQVGADHSLTVGKSSTVAIAGEQRVNVGGSYKLVVGQLGAGGSGSGDDPDRKVPWSWTNDLFSLGKLDAVAYTTVVVGAQTVTTGGDYNRITVGMDVRLAVIGDVRTVLGMSVDSVSGKRFEHTRGPKTEVVTGTRKDTVKGFYGVVAPQGMCTESSKGNIVLRHGPGAFSSSPQLARESSYVLVGDPMSEYRRLNPAVIAALGGNEHFYCVSIFAVDDVYVAAMKRLELEGVESFRASGGDTAWFTMNSREGIVVEDSQRGVSISRKTNSFLANVSVNKEGASMRFQSGGVSASVMINDAGEIWLQGPKVRISAGTEVAIAAPTVKLKGNVIQETAWQPLRQGWAPVVVGSDDHPHINPFENMSL